MFNPFGFGLVENKKNYYFYWKINKSEILQGTIYIEINKHLPSIDDQYFVDLDAAVSTILKIPELFCVK